MVRLRTNLIAATLGATLSGTGANAITVQWADLTSVTSTTVSGNIGTVGVTYAGPYSFVQLSGGIDYWVETGPTPYTNGVVNRPPLTDVIALFTGGAKTITFSEAVKDPYLAFTSWNGNTVTFSTPFVVISQGCGFWGCGTFNVLPGNLGFFGNGEVHGVLQFSGTFTSLTFTDTSENWHGFTVGIDRVASEVPVPAALPLFVTGLAAFGLIARRRKKQAA